MYNEETIKLLENIGVSENDDKTRQVFYALIKHYGQDRRNAKLINEELKALRTIAQTAINIAKDRYSLKKDPNTHEPIFKYSWNPNTLSWTIEADILKAKDDRVSGRHLTININQRAANNNLNPDDIKRMFNSKFEATQALLPPADQSKLNEIRKRLQNELHALCARFAETIKTDVNGIDEILKDIKKLQRKTIMQLAVATVQSGSTIENYNPTVKEIIDASQRIRQSEINMISSRKRPVLMHVYFQDNVNPKQLQCLVNLAEPLNDACSDYRDKFKNDMPANYFRTTNQVVYLDQKAAAKPGEIGGIIARSGALEEFYRSASLTELKKIDDTDDVDVLEQNEDDDAVLTRQESSKTVVNTDSSALERQKIVLRKILIDLAKNQIISLFVDSKPGESPLLHDKTLDVKLSVDTLLSPTMQKKHGEVIAQASKSSSLRFLLGNTRHETITKAATGTLVVGNERLQLEEMLKCFSSMNMQELVLNENERQEIYLAIKNARPDIKDISVHSIRHLKLKSRVSYLNIPVNKAFNMFGRQVASNLLDFGSYNNEYNKYGLVQHRKNIVDFINEVEPDKIKTIAILEIFENTTLDHARDWNKIRLLLGGGNKDKIKTLTSKFNPRHQEKMQDLILAYTRINDYLFSKKSFYQYLSEFINNTKLLIAQPDQKQFNARIAQGYMIATSSLFVMNKIMEIPNQLTCKSGKDRTGLFCLLREALLDSENDAKLIDNICNALKYSSAQALNEMNNPGCRGLQIDADILSGLKELFGTHFTGVERIEAILRENRTRAVGALGKANYNIISEAKDWVSTHPATNLTDAPSATSFKTPGTITTSDTTPNMPVTSRSIALLPGLPKEKVTLTHVEPPKRAITPEEEEINTQGLSIKERTEILKRLGLDSVPRPKQPR